MLLLYGWVCAVVYQDIKILQIDGKIQDPSCARYSRLPTYVRRKKRLHKKQISSLLQHVFVFVGMATRRTGVMAPSSVRSRLSPSCSKFDHHVSSQLCTCMYVLCISAYHTDTTAVALFPSIAPIEYTRYTVVVPGCPL